MNAEIIILTMEDTPKDIFIPTPEQVLAAEIVKADRKRLCEQVNKESLIKKKKKEKK